MMNVNEDGNLVRQAILGDRKAFNAIIIKHKNRVYCAAMRLVRNRDDAYDITQDVFLNAYMNLRRFKGESDLFTWLYRITINVSLNFMKRDKFRNMASVSDLINEPESMMKSDERLNAVELNSQLDRAIRELPPQQRAIFVMRYYDEMSNADIARILGRSEGAVKANYFQAIRKLRNSISDSKMPNANVLIRKEA